MSSDSPSPSRNSFADLGPRLISAAVLLAATIAAVWIGGVLFALFTGAAFALLYREWELITSLQKPSGSGLVLAGLVGLMPLAGVMGGPLAIAIVAVAGMLIGSALRPNLMGWRVVGLGFTALVVAALVAVRGTGFIGFIACFFLGASVWMTDTGAFFTGRQFGGAKLNPEISPAKTWSGAIGGLIIGALSGLIVWLIAVPQSPWWIGLFIAAGISVAGQLGDLAESGLKRRFRVKDSGDMIPGHGGLMDRLDSLTFGALFVFVVGLVHQGLSAVPEGILIW